MAYSAEEVDDLLANAGSISALKSVQPHEIADPELSFYWGKAKDKLSEFERAEDEIVRILDHRYSKGWQE